MSFYEEAYKENTTWLSKDHLIDAESDISKITYFSLTEQSISDAQKKLEDANIKEELKDYYTKMLESIPIWKFIILNFVESHSEVFSLDKGLSDSFTIMSTGTNVIRVMFSGVLQNYEEYDYALDFIYIYDNFFRGYRLEDNNLELQVVTENTVFNFKPLGIQYSQDPNMPDFVRLVMQGIAYKYFITDETSSPLTGL